MKQREKYYQSKLPRAFKALLRRKAWFLRNVSPGTARNFVSATTSYLTRRTQLTSMPVALKVDISPLCNLRCTFCIHGTADPKERKFHKEQRMTVEDFSRLVNEVKGRTSAISLYYLGDPLTHPDLNELCSVARAANIYTYVSTNFSFNLSDEQIDNLATSGLSHLKVCVDGLTQAVYERTRTGGRISLVLDNLKRVAEARTRLKSDMVIEVQYITNEWNSHQVEEAKRLMDEIGIEEMTTYQGADYTMEEIHPRNFEVLGPQDSGWIPNCYWPYYFMTVKWNGDVIPCCSFRQDEQYDIKSPTNRILGNVFDTGLEAVWNSTAYQNARRFVSNPSKFMNQSSSAEQEFCYGCKRVCSRRKISDEAKSTNQPESPRYDPTALPVLSPSATNSPPA